MRKFLADWFSVTAIYVILISAFLAAIFGPPLLLLYLGVPDPIAIVGGAAFGICMLFGAAFAIEENM